MNHLNIGNLSENPKNPDGRNNVNVNVNVNGNVNKNVNSSLSPENPPDSSGENNCSLDGFCPENLGQGEKSGRIPEKQLSKNPDLSGQKNLRDKKSGRIDETQVLKNPDESGQNDNDKNPE